MHTLYSHPLYAAVIFVVWKLPICHIGDVWNGIFLN